jgi:hypothetical protein
MYTLTDSAPSGMTLLDFPAPAGRVIAGAFDDALETNPVPLFMMARELHSARGTGQRLTREQAAEQTRFAGVNVTVPEDGISENALRILIERRKDHAARDMLFARREGAASTAGMFGVGLVGPFMDPLNAAAGFFPSLSGTRYAATLAQAVTHGGRAGVRLGVGAAEGLVGAALVEAPTIALRRELQDEYGLYDSLANIAFGTFASAGLRSVSGALRDRWRGLAAARQEDFLRAVEPSEWAAARSAYQSGLERDMDVELRGGFERGGGPAEGLVGRWATEREAAARLVETDEAIARQRMRFSDEEIGRFVEAEKKFRAESAAPGADERMLLDAAGVAERKFREIDLAEVRERLKRGEGLIIVPGNQREVVASIGEATHANALKTAVAQAIEGRRIDVDPVVRQDPVFGAQRMNQAEARARALANQQPEAKVAADPAASKKAAEIIKLAESEGVRVQDGVRAEAGGGAATIPKAMRKDHRVVAHEVSHAFFQKWAMTGEIKGPAYKELRAELRAASREFRPEVWKDHPDHAGKSQELLADALSIWLLRPEKRSAMPKFKELMGDRLETLSNKFDEQKTEAPALEPGVAEPPPPRGPRGEGAGAEAKTPEMVELEARLAAARAEFEAAAREAGIEPPKPKPGDVDAMQRAQDYERAWQAVAACVKGKGV